MAKTNRYTSLLEALKSTGPTPEWRRAVSRAVDATRKTVRRLEALELQENSAIQFLENRFETATGFSTKGKSYGQIKQLVQTLARYEDMKTSSVKKLESSLNSVLSGLPNAKGATLKQKYNIVKRVFETISTIEQYQMTQSGLINQIGYGQVTAAIEEYIEKGGTLDEILAANVQEVAGLILAEEATEAIINKSGPIGI